MPLSPDLLDKLACPKCRGPLALAPALGNAGGELACSICDLAYEVVADIPNLIIAEARPLGIK